MAPRNALSSVWEQAACRSADPDLFFPMAGPRAGLTEIRAKAVCARCPVREPCLDYAIETGQPHGVWGGTTVDERHTLAARRRRHRTRQALADATA
jgi:WhiB family transcriptional regulator, redox-sensing transcriptional regulator